jgi:site-specific recombinase XerD
MIKCVVSPEELLGDRPTSELRKITSALRRAGYPISPNGELAFDSESEATAQSGILKKRLDLVRELIRDARARFPVGTKHGYLVRRAVPGILKGRLESGPVGVMRWLRRWAKSEYVAFLRTFLTKRLLIPAKLPDFVDYLAKRREELIEEARWDGLHEEDQALMREYLRQINTRYFGRTSQTYKTTLNHLSRAMRSCRLTRLEEIGPEHITALLDELEERKFKKRSQHKVLINIRQFFRWLIDEKRYLKCPVLRRHFPKFIKPDPRPLTSHEMGAIRAALDGQLVGSMARAFFYLVYLTGLRPTEALSVRLTDINRACEDLFIARGKGNKTGYVPIARYAVDRIDEWLANSPMPPGCEHIFHRNGLQIGSESVDAMRNEIIEVGKVNFTWRHLRTTFATRLAEYKVSPFVIQRLLRHSRLNMIMTYVAFPDSQVRESYADLAARLLDGPLMSEPTCLGTAVTLINPQEQANMSCAEAVRKVRSPGRTPVGRCWKRSWGLGKSEPMKEVAQPQPDAESPRELKD